MNAFSESRRWKPQKSILVVEDDRLQREAMVRLLGNPPETAGYSIARIFEAATGEEAVRIADSEVVDLIVLDVCLEGGVMDGFDVCRQLRSKQFAGRVIMMSGERIDGNERALGLETGADDYMLKPYSFRELRARIENQLQAAEAASNAVLRFGPFTFFRDSGCIRIEHGRPVRLTDKPERLTDKEAGIIIALYSARGAVVSRQTMLEQVWGYNSGVNTHTLETHIYRVREKIEPVPRKPEFIVTSEGGYRLVWHPVSAFA